MLRIYPACPLGRQDNKLKKLAAFIALKSFMYFVGNIVALTTRTAL